MFAFSTHGPAAAVRAATILLVAMAFTACAVRLAPEHDPRVEEGLAEVHQTIEEMLVGMELGDAAARSYNANTPVYVETLSKLRVLEVLARTRPQPSGGILGTAAKNENALNISAANFRDIIANLEDMAADHRDADMNDTAQLVSFIRTWRPVFGESLAAALAYERALNR